ncbi:MAG: hypothetical protein C0506_13850 [Anaerolinea sp.]|nr:hypothetical protein [Anaerolinea sp.]
MENTLHAIALWMHILGIALFVGPQFFLAFAWVPTSRGITDLPTRVQAMRTITRRFLWVGGIGLGLILVAGIYLIASWRSYYTVPEGAGFNSLWYGALFSAKMLILVVMLTLTGIHTFVVGPRQVDLMDQKARGGPVTDEQIAAVRKRSMMLSISGLVLTLVIMAFGVAMNTANFSLQEI